MYRIELIALSLALLLGCSSGTSNQTSLKNGETPMWDIELADVTFRRILKKHGEDVDPSMIPIPQQTVILVYHSFGLIGNGGFHYLFEGDFPGDPEFLLTRKAYKTIGPSDASTAFEKAFAVFPNSTPPANINRRLEMWQSKYSLRDAIDDKSSPDALYFSAMDGVMEKLNLYIKSNEAEFASLPEWVA